ncbi:hypothetical protein M3Y98_00707300 [Aphelenchoides besseyi]|nr:hypothetical protein M3Y98_00707300 [Aphelenchoides besseyi]
MSLASAMNDPNVALWRIDDYTEQYRQSIGNDQMASEPFVFNHPAFGDIGFHLRFEPKQTDEPSPAYLYMQIADAPFDFLISMDCEMWIESLEKERYEAEAVRCPTFYANSSSKVWWSSFTAQQKSEFFRSPTIFVCHIQ